ncbi:MAG TPA: DUF2330 domain-containing protein [Acidimicrobiales bacterium]|nr:DUF2330 domain-containing protein [Acidimicrobiales bacterium]
MRKILALTTALAAAVLVAEPALACGGLVAPNGTVRLLRTSTLAAYVDGVEHYVTSFQFAGGGAEVGSIVPLPGIPTNVERGGDWTLQRLARETQPQPELARADAVALSAGAPAEVLLETRIDALDLTVLKGGGQAVGDWAREHGFQLTPDAPEVLDFYARKSPIFLAARFDATAARAKGQEIGDGTPIHLTIPTERPWVPIRILALGRAPKEPVEADVYLLTEGKPALLTGSGLRTESSSPASTRLLDDLRSDKGMEWVPQRMWLTYVRVDGRPDQLRHDLAVEPNGGAPSLFDFDRAGQADAPAVPRPTSGQQRPWLPVVAVAGAVVTLAAVVRWAR